MELGSNFATFEEARAGVMEYIKKLNAAQADTLAALLADPWSSRTLSVGGGSKSLSTKSAADIEKLESIKCKRIARLMYAIGEAPHPSQPTTHYVEFNG